MTKHGTLRFKKMALVMAGLSAAVLSIGATEPIFPELGRGDQASDVSRCVTETVDGRSFTVAFRPGDEPITARQVWDREVPPADWPYVVTLRLIEI